MSEQLRAPENAENPIHSLPEQARAVSHEISPVGTPDRSELVNSLLQEQDAHSEIEAALAEAPLESPLDQLHAEQAAAIIQEPQRPDAQLKQIGFNNTMRHLRRGEPKLMQYGSIFIHEKYVRAISGAAGKTAARPSGLFGGGVLAFLGSCLYLYFTKHLGVPYNYLLFFMFFIAGFIIGLVAELVIHAVSHKQEAEVQA